jgi:transposase-like protein
MNEEAKFICPSCNSELSQRLLDNPKTNYPLITEPLSDYRELHAYRRYKIHGGHMVCPECQEDLNITAVVEQIAEFKYYLESCQVRIYMDFRKGGGFVDEYE